MSGDKKMPKIGFKMMVGFYRIMDLFYNPHKKLGKFEIYRGDVVVDYGCGPGRYIKKASELVGDEGRVYAADILEVALDYVEKKIEKYSLYNVTPILVQDGITVIKSNTADVIYALDMFHHVNNSEAFFSELHRILKGKGKLYLEDGHQSRVKTKSKIEQSELWEINNEQEEYLLLKLK